MFPSEPRLQQPIANARKRQMLHKSGDKSHIGKKYEDLMWDR
jgi:hypothetical protein